MRTLVATGPPVLFEVVWLIIGPGGKVEFEGSSLVLADGRMDALTKLEEIWSERFAVSANPFGS